MCPCRDLATRNVLLRDKTRQCVVGDFGMSRKVDSDDGAKTSATTGPLVNFVVAMLLMMLLHDLKLI
jgi:hypothetical protein